MGGRYRLSFDAIGFAQGKANLNGKALDFSVSDGGQVTTFTEDFINDEFSSSSALFFTFDIPAKDAFEYGICFQEVNLFELQ